MTIYQHRAVKLAKHLAGLPPKGFDMSAWVQFARPNYDEINVGKLLRKAHKNKYACGMAACIGGHCALVFPRLVKFEGYDLIWTGKVEGEEESYLVQRNGFKVVQKLLGIQYAEAVKLCRGSRYYETPRHAAIEVLRVVGLDETALGE